MSYSLTMIPPFERVIEAARADLAPGGAIGVVDFLDARPPLAGWLAASHVALGGARLAALERAFPAHRVKLGRTGLWRYFLFWGDRA
jgi:S-adenosylmethionine-diacylgycerolhomoserine-N-methlytransferase